MRRSVVEIDDACDALKVHILHKRIHQLRPHDRRFPLHLDQVVQRVGNCIHGVISIRRVRALGLVVCPAARER